MVRPQVRPFALNSPDISAALLVKNQVAMGGVAALTEWLQPRWQKDWHMRTAVKDALEVYDIPLWRLIDETGSVRHLFFLCRLRAHSLRSSYS